MSNRLGLSERNHLQRASAGRAPGAGRVTLWLASDGIVEFFIEEILLRIDLRGNQEAMIYQLGEFLGMKLWHIRLPHGTYQ